MGRHNEDVERVDAGDVAPEEREELPDGGEAEGRTNVEDVEPEETEPDPERE